jgi:hypothetical protein
MDISKSTLCAHLELSIAGAAGCSVVLYTIEGESPAADGILSSVEFEAILVVPTLCTNLLSTGLIAWKAWYALLASNPRQQLSLIMSLVKATPHPSKGTLV